MVSNEKLEKFLNSDKKFLRVLHVDGLVFEGEFGEIEERPNGKILKLKGFNGEDIGIYLEAIRDIKFQDF